MSKEVLAQSFAEKERQAAKEMVTEADLTAQIEELDGKIDALDLPDKFKNDIKDKLDAVIEARDEEVKNLNAHAEQLLKDAFEEIKVELQNFLEQPDVKEIVETITPFISSKDKIIPHIDLISYESKSGHYQAINRKLQEDAGITTEQISSLQKLLGITVDGKVGPETINAMGKQLYDEDFSVQFSSETKYRDPAYVAPQSPPQAPPSAPKTPKLPEKGPKLSSAMQALKQRAAQIDKSVTGAEKTLAQRNRDVARAQEVLAQEQGQDMDEGTSWYEVFVPDNDESVDASVQTLTAMEELRDKAQQELNTLQQERKNILKETFVQYYCEGHKDPDFFLMVYRKLRDDLPDELRAPVQQAIQQRLASKDCTPFERAWLTGSYDEALQAATDEHKQKNVGKYFRNLSEHDIIEAYEQAKNNPDKRRTDFPAGSFAAQKLDEGFIALKIANTSAAVLAREGQGGALEYYIATREGYELTMSKAAGLKTISKAEQTQLKSSVTKTRQDMETLIDSNPTFERLRNVSNLLQAKLRPLQNLMVAGFSADKTEEFVKTARRYANDIRHSSELRELKSLMPETKAQLRILKGFSFGAHDEFEKRIIAMEEQFSSIADSVESGKLDDLCKFITSSDFDPATWQNWLIKYGIPMGFAILGGVLCMVTFGAGVPAVATIGAMLGIGKVGATIVVGAIGLAKVAAAGAVGGMIGQEVGHVVSEVGVRAFTDNDNFQNRSLLGKYVMDDKVFNPETGSYDEIKLGDVAKYYSANFVKSFALTFGLLGLGKLIGPFLARFVDKFKTANGFSTEGLKGGVARLMARLPRLGQSEIDLLKRGGTGNMMKKVAEEFLEESGEETAEGVAEKIHPALGFLASLYFCLSTSNVQYKFGKFAVAEVSREQNSDKNLVTTWSYNADSAADLFSTLESEYNNQGYEVTQDDDGTIHLTTDYTTKDGETLKNTMVFKPSKESVEMRRLLSLNRDGDGKSEIERSYGVAATAENEYAFENLTAAGRITLPQYLEQNGFKIQGKPKNGEFTATKGGETLRFKQKEGAVKQEVEEEAKQESKQESFQETPLANVVNPGALYEWLRAHGDEYHGYKTAELIANITAYVDSKGKLDPGNITNAGGLRSKVVEMVEIANFLEFQKQVSAEKRPYDAQLKQEPRLGNANQIDLGFATRFWLTSKSADEQWGSIIDQEHVDLMQRSHPREMEIKFNNGTTVRFIFPANYEGDIKRLQKDIVKAEQWVQQQFGEYNILPPKDLTILLMQGTARKPIRGHAGDEDVIMNVDDLKAPQDFLETYMHERTHTILNSNYNPYNKGVVEGIANYMAATGSQVLGLGKPRIARRSVRNISQEILALVKEGDSFEVAFWKFFDKQLNKNEHHLNYEYGQAFSEVFLKYFGGNMKQFVDLYEELSRPKYAYMPISSQLVTAMREIGISEDDAGAIAKQAAGLLMLKACKGNDLLSVLMQESPDRIKSILSEQTLTNIFGLDQPTSNELEAHVHKAIKFITENHGFFNKASAAKLIEILDAKLKAHQDARGLLQQTNLGLNLQI